MRRLSPASCELKAHHFAPNFCRAARRLSRRVTQCSAKLDEHFTADGQPSSGRPPVAGTRRITGPGCYAPIMKAMQSSSHAELERELFGSSAPPAATVNDIKLLTAKLKTARTWREVRDLLVAAERQEGGMDPIFVSAFFSALPKVLRRQPKLNDLERAEVSSAVQGVVSRNLEPMLDELDAQGLVNVAVGLAKLDHHEPLLFQNIARCSVPHMQDGHMTGQGLSNLAWAFATAGVRPCGSWLSEFWAELEDQVDALNGQDCANIFWSICRLELMPPWVSGSMPAMLPAALRCVGSTPTGQDPATVMVCLAIWSRTYSYRVPDELLAQMLAAMQPRLQHYLPQDLVSIVHSLVVMSASPSRAWMTDFYTVLRDRLIFDPTLSYSDFQRLLWALSRIDYVPSQAWLKQFVEVSIVKLRHLRFRALSELVWALACWGYSPTAGWLAEYFRVTYLKLQDYKPQHLANSIMALKKLGCKVPTPWLDAALLSFCAQLNDAKAHDLVMFIDGIVDVCEDAAWMSRPTTGKRLRSLADYAASKFDICDCVMHAKLLVALATAKCYPGVAWLSAQQDSLARSLGAEPPGALDDETAGSLKAAYAAWDVPLNPALAHELDSKAGSSLGATFKTFVH